VPTWKPDTESVSDPEKLRVLLLGLYSRLLPSGVLMGKPSGETTRNPEALLVCLTKMYGAAFILGAKNLPRPTSFMVSSTDTLLPWLVKLYEAVAP
jgi:hypothetical protein